jgi:hypothetical protein
MNKEKWTKLWYDPFAPFAVCLPRRNARNAKNVTGHFKTSQPGSNQNRPLRGALFTSGFLMQARGFSLSSYLLNGGTGYANGGCSGDFLANRQRKLWWLGDSLF